MIINSIGDRILELRNKLNISQEEMGNKIGVSRFSVSNYETGKKKVTDRAVKDICREFSVNYLWLTQGVGEMFSTKDDDLMTLVDNFLAGENETARALFKAFTRLNDSDWLVIKKLIDSLQKK